MAHQPSPEAIGAQIADILLLHVYDEDDGPATFAALTLVYEALKHAVQIVCSRRAHLVRNATTLTEPAALAKVFGTTAGVINLILRKKDALPKGPSGRNR